MNKAAKQARAERITAWLYNVCAEYAKHVPSGELNVISPACWLPGYWLGAYNDAEMIAECFDVRKRAVSGQNLYYTVKKQYRAAVSANYQLLKLESEFLSALGNQ